MASTTALLGGAGCKQAIGNEQRFRATRELYLTKFYFYQQHASSGTFVDKSEGTATSNSDCNQQVKGDACDKHYDANSPQEISTVTLGKLTANSSLGDEALELDYATSDGENMPANCVNSTRDNNNTNTNTSNNSNSLGANDSLNNNISNNGERALAGKAHVGCLMCARLAHLKLANQPSELHGSGAGAGAGAGSARLDKGPAKLKAKSSDGFWTAELHQAPQLAELATGRESCSVLANRNNNGSINSQQDNNSSTEQISSQKFIRRNSSPCATSVANLRQPSIEEQLRRLLDLGGTEEASKQVSDESARRRQAWIASMKKSSAGTGRDQYQSNQPAQCGHRARPDSSLSPDDRLMIFMLASRSTSINSPVERNARILKWLNNCRSAT